MNQQIRHVAIGLLLLSAVTACGGKRNFANDNDVLRARVYDLERQIDDLERANAEHEAKLAEHAAAAEARSPDILANTPRVMRVELSRLCHVRPADGDRAQETVFLYVEPEDGLGRFVQMVGHLSVNVAVLPAAGDAATVGKLALAPGELRAAYRSGFTGTHYSVELPVDLSAAGDARVLDVRVTFEDGLTGVSHSAHREIAFEPGGSN